MNKILLLVALICLAGLIVVCTTGCNTVHYTQTMTDGTRHEVYSSRFIWSTDSYKAVLPNGASLEATKSSADAQSITALTGLLQTAVKAGVAIAAPVPTTKATNN